MSITIKQVCTEDIRTNLKLYKCNICFNTCLTLYYQSYSVVLGQNIFLFLFIYSICIAHYS